MASRFKIGQRVTVQPTGRQDVSLRDSSLEPYVGEPGEVTDLYSISPTPGDEFFIYRVRIEAGRKTVVLHEDEMALR